MKLPRALNVLSNFGVSLKKNGSSISWPGLNCNLDDVRGRLVARDPFPSPEDAFAVVRREEMRRKVMLVENQFCHNLILLPWCPIRFCPLTNMHSNDHGVTTVTAQATQKTSDGKFTVNQRIGRLKEAKWACPSSPICARTTCHCWYFDLIYTGADRTN